MTRNITKLLDMKSMQKLDELSHFNPSPLSLRQFVEFGKIASEADSFDFLRREVPVRMANVMKEINLLPSVLLQMPSVLLIQEWYARSFMELCAFDGLPGERETLGKFVNNLAEIQRRHVNVVQTLAQGVLELRESHSIDSHTENSIQYFLDRFYMSRISTRMLTNQHLVLFGKEDEKAGAPPPVVQPNRIGVIDTDCKIKGLVEQAFQNAAFLCEEYYFAAPDIDITLKNAVAPGQPIQICYPPQHLYHILFELFKNAMRATVESHKKGQTELPDVEVLIAQGENDVCIKISDQGGGISRRVSDNLFTYLYSTAPRPSMNATKAPLAGYGYGLPLSRLYARYFHGDLILNSFDGYGTDAVVYLKSNIDESTELLPVFNKTSSKQYKTSTPTADWTNPASTMNRLYHPYQHYQTKVSST